MYDPDHGVPPSKPRKSHALNSVRFPQSSFDLIPGAGFCMHLLACHKAYQGQSLPTPGSSGQQVEGEVLAGNLFTPGIGTLYQPRST